MNLITIVGVIKSPTETLHILAKDAMNKNGYIDAQLVFEYFAFMNIPNSILIYAPVIEALEYKGTYVK